MITVYLDATRSELDLKSGAPSLYTVGCCIATQDNWRKFRKEWLRELYKKGLLYFHQTDFEYAYSLIRKGEPLPSKYRAYRHWDVGDFLPFGKRLQKVLVTCDRTGKVRLKGFASSILTADFDSLRPDNLKDDPRCRGYYIYNVNAIMGDLARWLRRRKLSAPIYYVFAQGDQEGANIDALFSDIWDDPEARAFYQISKRYAQPSYGFANMHDEPAIQAADVFAFELHKNVIRGILKDYPKKMPPELSRKSLIALAKGRPEGTIHRRQELAEGFKSIAEHNRKRRRPRT